MVLLLSTKPVHRIATTLGHVETSFVTLAAKLHLSAVPKVVDHTTTYFFITSRI